jgi:predicted P-loop ATPase/GTPase
MKNTDEHRKAAFDIVVKQEADEAKRVDAITSAHADQADEAKKVNDNYQEVLDEHRRNSAAPARDSLRFVDTENEDHTGKKYGGRALS